MATAAVRVGVEEVVGRTGTAASTRPRVTLERVDGDETADLATFARAYAAVLLSLWRDGRGRSSRPRLAMGDAR